MSNIYKKCLTAAAGAAWALTGAVAPQTAQALEGEHNRLPEICQGVAGAAYAVNEIASYITPVPFDLAPSAGAYSGNWALRLCPPQIVAPDAQRLEPDESDASSDDPDVPFPLANDPNCYATVPQATTKAQYGNFLGVPIRMPEWGGLGTPEVYHFNTAADVRILGSRRADDPSTDGDESLADELQTVREPSGRDVLRIPVGRNTLTYRADTLVSVLDFPFIYIPKLPSGSKAYKELIESSSSFKRAAIRGYQAFAGAVEIVNNPVGGYVLDEIIDINYRHGQLGVIDDVYNQDFQSVWVYDRIPPVLSTSTDVSSLSELVQAVLSYDSARGVYYLEAIHPGGIQRATGVGFLEQLLDYHDHCNRQVRLANDGGGSSNFWATGSAVSLRWTASDPGPINAGGGVNSVSLVHEVEIRDSYPPVLLAPPSQVIEIPSGQGQATVDIGAPRVYDLADLTPDVSHDALDDVFDLGLTEVRWTASDGFNTSDAVQLINIKEEGTNTAPTADARTVEARADEDVEIVLTGADADYHPSVDRFDPLTFSIVDEPDNGFFVAPLLPYFIDDYRLEASALRFADQPWQQDPGQYCRDRGGSYGPGEPSQWQMGYPYQAQWMAVDDDGNTVVYDTGTMQCTGGSSGDLSQSPRLAIFDANQDFVRSSSAPGAGQTVEDVYWHYATGYVYIIVTDNHGSDYVAVYDAELNRVQTYNLSNGGFPAALNNPRSIAVDGNGVMYVAGSGSVNAYRQTTEPTPDAGQVFLAQIHEPVDEVRSITAGSDGALYVSTLGRVEKVEPSGFDTLGVFQAGEFAGWLGACSANLTTEYACDTPNGRSVGFACTDALCERSSVYGDQPGQFNQVHGIQIDPNDVLYVSDWGNSRIQRFTPDGLFAGEAKSSGVGYGFLLGDFGRPDDIEVNADHFYILNRDAQLLHIFETTPITPIDDSSASVVYRSNSNYVGADSFRFGVTDGLDSAQADVAIDVTRNYRPPEVPVEGQALVIGPSLEDEPVAMVLPGTDPDGDLDTLSVVIVRAPEHGELSFEGLAAVYVPDPHYTGPDSFSYRVFDGLDTSDQVGEVSLQVDPVEDTPTLDVEPERDVSVGFRLAHRVDVFDPDADETLLVTVDWGDGLATVEGHFELDDGTPIPAADAMNADGTMRDDVEATGPILSVDPTGRGILLADHVYTRAGVYTVQSCVHDKAELDEETQIKGLTGASKQTCGSTTVEVVSSAELGVEAESPEDPVAPGAEVEFLVTLTNLEYELETDDPRYAELPAGGVAIAGLALSGELTAHLSLLDVSSVDGICATTGVGMFACDFANVSYGGSVAISVQARVAASAPGRAEPGLALDAEWLGMRAAARGAGQVEVARSGMAPTLASLAPTLGAPEGYTEVTIEGANFEHGMRVLFGGRMGSQVRVLDSTTLTVLTPAQPEGVVDVTVLNADDEEGMLGDAWTYQAPSSGGGGSGGGGSGGGGSGGGGSGGGSGGGGGGGGGGAPGPWLVALLGVGLLFRRTLPGLGRRGAAVGR